MKKIYLTIWIAITVFLLNIISASANDINIVGEMKDNFKLSIDNGYIFNRDNIVPGEEWSANITLQNNAKEAISISLININADNAVVSDCLHLLISDGETVLYEGDYINENNPYFCVNVKGMSSMRVTAVVKAVSNSGNQMQGQSLHSVWDFEAKTLKDLKPAASAKSMATSSGSSKGGYPSGIIARIFSNNDSSIQEYTGDNTPSENIPIEQEQSETNFRAENTEEKRAIDKASNSAASEGIQEKLDIAENENSKQKDKTNSKQKNKPVKTGNEYMNNTTTDITGILMILLSFITIAYIIITWRKRRKNKNG